MAILKKMLQPILEPVLKKITGGDVVEGNWENQINNNWEAESEGNWEDWGNDF
jgi:hypothetical protein